MSSQPVTPPLDMPAPMPAPSGEPLAPVKSFTRQVVDDALRQWGARVGVAWMIVMVLAAVFSPFIANSHPLLMKKAGQWSSPLLRNLGPADVDLLVIFFVSLIVMSLHGMSAGRKIVTLIGVIIITMPLAMSFVRPPAQAVYDQYRRELKIGVIEKAVFAPIPYSPDDRLRDQPELRLTGPTRSHLMGTTLNGADLFSNMIAATRIALSIGFISTGIAVVIGVVIGGLMGYYSGWIDLFGMRLVEIFDAIPTLYLLLCFVAFFGPNLYVMMAIIGATSWVGDAVFVRAEFLRLRQQDFVQAARACGLPLRSILFRHMLPNGITPVLVNISFGVAGAILAESTLSFLGIGLVNEASWGSLLNQALGVGGSFYWWIALYPGLAIFLTVFAYNLIGEALRDAIDPHLKKAAQI